VEDLLARIYERIVANTRNKNLSEEIRAFFLSLLKSRFVFDSTKRDEILHVVHDVSFDADVKKESQIFQVAKGIIAYCTSPEYEPYGRKVFNQLLKEAAGSDAIRSEKADDLISLFVYVKAWGSLLGSARGGGERDPDSILYSTTRNARLKRPHL